ncbi:FimD/PapC C-terminal domain-containing protein [Klebsiella pneumoniae]
MFMAGMPANGALHVQWGKQPEQQCQVVYSLPGTAGPEIPEIAAECR